MKRMGDIGGSLSVRTSIFLSLILVDRSGAPLIQCQVIENIKTHCIACFHYSEMLLIYLKALMLWLHVADLLV